MSLKIECAECGYQGRVSPAKAGLVIPCPSCEATLQVPSGSDKSAPASPAPRRNVRRPKADSLSTGYIALGGATILLAGVLAMIWIKTNQLGDEQLFDGVLPDADTTGQQTAADAESTPVTPAVSGEPNNVADTSPPPTSPVGADGPLEVTQVGDTDAVDNGDVILPEISAVAPETLLLAGMTEVVLQLEGFAADTRGAVENAVTAEVQAELRKCRLACVDTNDRPSFVVTLDLRQDGGVQKLGMTAELLGEVSGVPVSIWKHDAALIPVESKSLSGAVGLPGLDREVARFFTPLRDKLNTARTSIEAIRKNRERREEARRDGSRRSM